MNNKPPYKIIKHYRGKYQVLDANGMNLSRGYVSKHEAGQIVIAYKLQDTCLKNAKLLIAAESVAGSRFKNNMHQWLWEVLIRFEIDELRLINNRPNQFKAVHDAWIDRITNRLNNNYNMETKESLIKPMTAGQLFANAAAPLAEYLKANHHPHTKAIVTSESVEIVEGIKNLPDVFGTLAEYFKPE